MHVIFRSVLTIFVYAAKQACKQLQRNKAKLLEPASINGLHNTRVYFFRVSSAFCSAINSSGPISRPCTELIFSGIGGLFSLTAIAVACTAAQVSVASLSVDWPLASTRFWPVSSVCSGWLTVCDIDTCLFCCMYLSDFRFWLKSTCTRYMPNDYILHGCLHTQYFGYSCVVWRLKFNQWCGVTLNHAINEHTEFIRTSHLFWSDQCCLQHTCCWACVLHNLCCSVIYFAVTTRCHLCLPLS